MKVLLRADAGVEQGTGHVMRCLTLGQTLSKRGHTVSLMGSLGGVEWLTELTRRSGIQHIASPPDELDVDSIASSGWDWVVIDSYSISSNRVSRLNGVVQCLAIVDGDTRGISATLYLDQNLGTKLTDRKEIATRLLAGNSYALIRDAVLQHRRPPETISTGAVLRVAAFMGGTDPGGALIQVARSMIAQNLNIELDLVAAESSFDRATAAVADSSNVRVLEPTPDLPDILGRADVVVSAAGTSAWDICTMARPAVLVALVGNQLESLTAIAQAGLTLTVDATSSSGESLSQVGDLVASLVNDRGQRVALAGRCWDAFDGLGKIRVAETMERMCQR